MSAEFPIKITAKESDAAAVIKKVSDQAKKSAEDIGKVGKKSGDIGKLKKPFNEVEKAANGVAKGVKSIGQIIGVAVGGYSLASVVEMNRQWAEWGAEIRRTSGLLGIAETKMQNLRVGASMGGLSPEAMTGAVANLGKILEDSITNRNIDATNILSYLQVNLKKTKTGAIDTAAALDDISDAISRYQGHPLVQAEIASRLGLTGILPLISKGSANFHKLQREGQAYNPALSKEAIDRAEKEAEATRALTGAITGAKNALMDQFSPAITNIATFWADWLTKNRISTETADALKKTGGEMLMHPLDSIGNAAHFYRAKARNWLVEKGLAMGGKTNPYDFPYNHPDTDPYSVRNTFADPDKSLSMTGTDEAIRKRLKMRGYSDAHISGILANINAESGGNPGAVGDGGSAYGIAQWHPDRQELFSKWSGHSIKGSSVDEQVDFMDWELRNSEKKAGDMLSNAGTAREAAFIMSSEYERPAGGFAEAMRRAGNVDQGSVKVDVNFTNAPAGTRVNTQSSGSVISQTKIGHSMEGVSP